MKRVSFLLAILLIAATCFAQTANRGAGQNPGFPRVVARLNLLNRSNQVGPETIFVPKSAGVFRLSAAIVCTVANDLEGQWDVAAQWTNEVGLNGGTALAQVPTNFVSSSYNFLPPLVLNASKGGPITISVDGSNTAGSQYNAYIILEQLE